MDWLGEVPEHWDMRRVGTVADLRVSNVDKHVKEGEQPVRLCNYVDVYHNERISPDVPFMVGTARRREIRRFRLAVGDVLVTKDSEDWTDIGVPALVEYAADDLVCGYHLAMLRPNRAFLDGGYLFQALRDSRLAWQFQVAAAGVTRYGLSKNAIRSMRIPLPPLSEQTAIAGFLDHADRRIQRYIRAKERLIELLEEQKQAIIHQAVTGQIDVRTGQPYPAYKDSGVEWLGEVPEHWEVLPLKRWVSTKITDGPHETPDFLPAGVPFLSAEAVSDGRLDFGRRRGFISQEIHEMYCRKCRPQRDDIFMCKSGATTGKVAMVETDDEFSVWSPLALIRVDAQRVIAKLLFRVLQSRYLQGQVHDTWSFGTQPNLAMRAMERLVIALPPLDEQRAILGWLDGRLLRSYRTADLARREIELVREYRTRLIADVVTGKLDVREAAANLPDIDPLHCPRCPEPHGRA